MVVMLTLPWTLSESLRISPVENDWLAVYVLVWPEPKTVSDLAVRSVPKKISPPAPLANSLSGSLNTRPVGLVLLR